MTKDNRQTVNDEQYVLVRRNDNYHDLSTSGYVIIPIATNFNKEVLGEIKADIEKREYNAGDYRHSYKIFLESALTRFKNLFQNK